MKLKKNLIFLMAFIFGLGLFHVEAQYRNTRSSVTGSKFRPRIKRKKPRNYINSIKGDFMLGYAAYSGDLCSGMDCLDPQIATTLGLTYRLNESLSLRAGLSYLRLTADDKNTEVLGRKRRNLHFRSDNIDFSVVARYDIFEHHKMYRRRGPFAPYIYLGLGFVHFTPKAELNGQWYDLSEFNTEGVDYSNVAFIIPYGFGLTIKASPHLDFLVDIGMRYAFTDYLDDVSDKYAVQSELSTIGQQLSDRVNEFNGVGTTSNATGYVDRSGAKRGGAETKDGYYMARLGLSYTLQVTRQSYNINSNVSRLRIIKSIKRK